MSSPPAASTSSPASSSFSLRRIAVPAFGPSLLFGLGEGAILPIVPLTARELGASVPIAALMVALIGIGSLLNNIPASMITMRWGERWAIVVAGVWSGLGMALCVWTSHLGLFATGCFMVGMSQAVYNLARQSYMTEAVPAEFRARALSTLGGVMRIGMFAGPFLAAGAVHVYGLPAAYVVGIVAVMGAAALGARIPDLEVPPAPPGQAAPAPTTIVSTLRDHRRVFLTLGLGVMLVSAVRASRQAVIPLWADHLMLAPSVASLIYGLAGGIDMLVFYPAGKVMDQKGRRWVAVPSMLIMGAGDAADAADHRHPHAAAGGAGHRLRQRHRLGNDHDAGRRPLAAPRARALSGRVAAHVRHRFLVRPGAAVVPGGQPVPGLRHCRHRADRLRRGGRAGVLDSRPRQGAQAGARHAGRLSSQAAPTKDPP
jgi:MFS family permease